jgi:pyridoxamine 5'-phosphate oxidase family protein
VDAQLWIDHGQPIGADLAGAHREEVGTRLGADFPFDAAWIRIRPRRILAWGIDSGAFELSARDVPADVSVPERAA